MTTGQDSWSMQSKHLNVTDRSHTSCNILIPSECTNKSPLTLRPTTISFPVIIVWYTLVVPIQGRNNNISLAYMSAVKAIAIAPLTLGYNSNSIHLIYIFVFLDFDKFKPPHRSVNHDSMENASKTNPACGTLNYSQLISTFTCPFLQWVSVILIVLVIVRFHCPETTKLDRTWQQCVI